ncbi:MAG: 4-hydroxy-tetrahydrodipicolinate reductase, partial [Candidatus Omnitrophica bacterium]|nr:4-hydroxy-tetrahydrodipicolinate reductase [Candidatus Omnitrophota bacterium]
IVEAHHIHKKDAPSGTAKEMARIVKDVSKNIEVPIESVREDEIVGEHTITFDSPTDLVEITHSAKTRDIFANGALKAAKFIVGKPAGLYSMKDVLGL